jgi:hypothetical protein
VLSIDLARRLRDAGFSWTPTEHDTFMIPDTGMDQKVFVISEVAALVQPLAGVQHITFHGSSEWALDHVMVGDAVWLPSETQLRLALEERIPGGAYVLEHRSEGYRCVLLTSAGNGQFHPSAEDAYASALLFVLEHPGNTLGLDQ